MGKLTKGKIAKFTKPGRYSDGDGLLLKVDKGGSKSWIFRVQVDGRRRDLGLGPWPVVSLQRARLKVMETRLAIWEGKDVVSPHRKRSVLTFEQAARKTHAALSPKWRNEKGKKVWMQRLEKYAFPPLGTKRVNRITRADVIACLSPHWSEKRETMRKTKQYISAVFNWCIAQGLIETNPASALGAALPKLSRKGENMRAIPHGELSEAVRIVEESATSLSVKLAFLFVVYTCTRSGEVRGARWSEIDGNVWSIPGHRTKSGRSFRVPLSDAALSVLERAVEIRDEGVDLLFPSSLHRGKEMSDAIMMKMIHDLGLGEKMTIHGLRATFRSWCSDVNQPRELAEEALSHRFGDAVEMAYVRTDALERRGRLMQKWANYLAGSEGAKVVQIAG